MNVCVDVALRIAETLTGYSLAVLYGTSKFWKCIIQNHDYLWKRLLSIHAVRMLTTLPTMFQYRMSTPTQMKFRRRFGFLRTHDNLQNVITCQRLYFNIFICAHSLCGFVVRATRDEISCYFTIFQDAIRTFMMCCKIENASIHITIPFSDPLIIMEVGGLFPLWGLPGLQGVTQRNNACIVTAQSWKQLQDIMYAIPLLSRWDAIHTCLLICSKCCCLRQVLCCVAKHPGVIALACSKRSTCFQDYQKTKYELRRIARRFSYLMKQGIAALNLLNYDVKVSNLP